MRSPTARFKFRRRTVRSSPVLLIDFRIAIGLALNRKLVQVIVLPIHHGLNNFVEPRERAVIRNQDAAPHPWVNMLEIQAKLKDLPDARHDRNHSTNSLLRRAVPLTAKPGSITHVLT